VAHYRRVGDVPPKRHTQHRREDGRLFEELAVMVDTFRHLDIGEAGRACEDPGCAWTWAGRGPA
jgi:homogentisate 1,2-dioxygenase